MTYSGSTTRIRRQSPTETPKQYPVARPSVATTKCRRDLDKHIRSIGAALGPEGTADDLRRSRVIFDQIADLVRAGGNNITDDDYVHLLRHLTRIYSSGDAGRGYDAFAATASAYARVIKALSRRCPMCDYRESIGQLLDLMTRLFQTRHPSWKSIFRLLRAIPTSVNGRERLERVCSVYVHEWFDEGVPNHYSLRRELHREIEELDLEIEPLNNAIRVTREDLETINAGEDAPRDRKVTILAVARKKRQIDRWQRSMRQSLAQRDEKSRAATLVESDIQELGDRLRRAASAYRLHLVKDN